MNTLIEKLKEAGLTEEESVLSLQSLQHWLEANYPVLATVSRSELTNQRFRRDDEGVEYLLRA
ncbi:MAG TPA: hypothetical protein VHK69_21015 [Chitinophagaceae bacterium]|jgi:hypothetical protein|nr:hypothetical protein [Chitinophagaceae bacterium]